MRQPLNTFEAVPQVRTPLGPDSSAEIYSSLRSISFKLFATSQVPIFLSQELWPLISTLRVVSLILQDWYFQVCSVDLLMMKFLFLIKQPFRDWEWWFYLWVHFTSLLRILETVFTFVQSFLFRFTAASSQFLRVFLLIFSLCLWSTCSNVLKFELLSLSPH